MQAFDGAVYFGHGDSGSDAGPVPVVRYTPTLGFVAGYNAADEQIDRFNIVGGKLVTPTNDPRGIAGAGFHRLTTVPDTWSRVGTAPTSVTHVYDVIEHGGALFIGGGDGLVWRSADGGATWKNVSPQVSDRVYSLFVHNGTLWAYTLAWTGTGPTNAWFKWNGTAMERVSIPVATTWPSHGQPDAVVRMARHMVVGSRLLYVGAKHDDMWRWLPGFGLYVAATPTSPATKVTLPQGYQTFDLLDDGQSVYLLAGRRNATDWTVAVLRADDRAVLTSWTEQFSFTASTFARSFERLGDSWYFGLGSNGAAPHADTGTVLRYGP
jgi:hypothetical protein